MSLRLTFLSLFGGCTHPQTYRERRELHGVQVLHLVCEDCGHAVPALQRTPEEHRQMVQTGAIKPATVHRLPSRLVPVAGVRRRAQTPGLWRPDQENETSITSRELLAGRLGESANPPAERVG
jgi:hypothetical protein